MCSSSWEGNWVKTFKPTSSAFQIIILVSCCATWVQRGPAQKSSAQVEKHVFNHWLYLKKSLSTRNHPPQCGESSTGRQLSNYISFLQPRGPAGPPHSHRAAHKLSVESYVFSSATLHHQEIRSICLIQDCEQSTYDLWCMEKILEINTLTIVEMHLFCLTFLYKTLLFCLCDPYLCS